MNPTTLLGLAVVLEGMALLLVTVSVRGLVLRVARLEQDVHRLRQRP